MNQISLSQSVINMLSTATYGRDGDIYTVDFAQQTPETYRELKKVMPSFGLKWNRGKKVHQATHNPQPLIEYALESGTIDEPNPFSFFSTPPELAAEMIEQLFAYTGTNPDFKILEPSAGTGALLDAFGDRKGDFHVYELEPANVKLLQSKGYDVTAQNFLTIEPEEDFDLVIMNPPFRNKNNTGDFIDHIQHAYKFLKEGAELIAIVPNSVLYNSTKKFVNFRNFVARNDGWVSPNEVEFENAKVATCMLKLVKRVSPHIEPSSSYQWLDYQVGKAMLRLDSEYEYWQAYEKIGESLNLGEILMEDAIEKAIALYGKWVETLLRETDDIIIFDDEARSQLKNHYNGALLEYLG